MDSLEKSGTLLPGLLDENEIVHDASNWKECWNAAICLVLLTVLRAVRHISYYVVCKCQLWKLLPLLTYKLVNALDNYNFTTGFQPPETIYLWIFLPIIWVHRWTPLFMQMVIFSFPWSIIRNGKNNPMLSNCPLEQNENSVSKTTSPLWEINYFL